MLRSMQELTNYTIGASDGEIGHVSDFFFDDDMWTIRYLVVETGSWLMSRKVLISPFSLLDADWLHKRLPVRITRDQVKNSPNIDTQKPVSRQQEIFYSDYYDYPYYWGGTDLWGDDLFLIVDTSNWWLGHQVLIAPSWISDRSWSDARVSVTMTRQAVQSSPRFESTEQLNRQYEMDLYRHYERPTYWERETAKTTNENGL